MDDALTGQEDPLRSPELFGQHHQFAQGGGRAVQHCRDRGIVGETQLRQGDIPPRCFAGRRPEGFVGQDVVELLPPRGPRLPHHAGRSLVPDEQLIGYHRPGPDPRADRDDGEVVGAAPMTHPVLGECEGVDVVGRLAGKPAGLGHERRQVAVLPAEQRRGTHLTERVHRRRQCHSDRAGFVSGELLDDPGNGLRGRFEGGCVRGADSRGPHVTGQPGDHRVQFPRYHLDTYEPRGVVDHHQGKRGPSELFHRHGSLLLEDPRRDERRGQPGHRTGTQAGALGDADPGDGAVAQNRLHH